MGSISVGRRAGLVLIAAALMAAGPEPQAPGTGESGTPPAQAGPDTTEQAGIPVFSVPADKVVAVLGQPVFGPLGAVMGRLVDVLVDNEGMPQAAVIDFGGFLGVGSRKIAVHWSTLHFNPGDSKYPIVLDLMPAQIKAAPSYKGESKPAPVVVAPWEPPPAGASPATPATATPAKPAAPQ
jgi:hypothetical protein